MSRRAGKFNLNLSIISEGEEEEGVHQPARLTVVGTAVELKAKAHSARVVGQWHQPKLTDADDGRLQVVLFHRVRVQVSFEVLLNE